MKIIDYIIVNIPSWAICYLVNDDASGLEDNEIDLAYEWWTDLKGSYEKDYPGCDVFIEVGNEETDFDADPEFGLAGSTTKCAVVVMVSSDDKRFEEVVPRLEDDPAWQDQSVWRPSDISKPVYEGEIEFQDNEGEFHHFHIIATKHRIVFGGACNAGFIESGYLVREEGESLNDGLAELIEDLETFYNDGPLYVNRIVLTERM
jgi:hypothetical protein